MECNIEEIVWQIVESSSVKIEIRSSVKDEKEWHDWLQDLQLKSNSAWIARNTSPHAAEQY
jgi:ArsR family metal-binding transcriptional regulator